MEKFLDDITYFPSLVTFYWNLIFSWGFWGIKTNSTFFFFFFFFNVIYCSGPVRCADTYTLDFSVFHIIFLLAPLPWSPLLTTFFESVQNPRVISTTYHPFIVLRPFSVLRTVTFCVPFLFLPPSPLLSFSPVLFLSFLFLIWVIYEFSFSWWFSLGFIYFISLF